MKNATLLIFAVVFTLLGLGGGYYAAAQRSSGGEHGHEEHADAHDEHAHETAKPKLAPQTIKNLGVVTKEAETRTFFRYVPVSAVVAETHQSEQPLFAPAGGTVLSIEVQPGTLVESGKTILRIARDPIPRPALTLTEEIMKPATEQFHTAVGELRQALRGVQLLRTELERVKKFTLSGTEDGVAILPKKNEIDLRYDLARAEQGYQNARENLRLHGISDEQLEMLEQGKQLTGESHDIWKRALQRNGLWTAHSEAIFAALPSSAKSTAWNVAAIGELTGAGLATAELADWLKADNKAGQSFLEIAGLLQQGQSLERIKVLRSLNALDPVVQVIVPNAAADWDVEQILVKPLERVESGARLALLSNPRVLQLRAEPIGSESSALLNAFKQKIELEAVPLAEGSGPPIKGVTITSVSTDDQTHATVAFVRITNEPLAIHDHGDRGKVRTWQLRPGQKYMLRVPTDKYEDVYVLPGDAITDDGPNKVAFIRDGDSFKQIKVELLYQDHESAVIANNKDTELFPGDEVVQHGAFGLNLALKSGGGEEGGEGGHHHHHHH